MSFRFSRFHNCAGVAVLVLVVTLISIGAFATQPVQFNYQAKLTDSNGAPLEGTHTFYFSIWSPGNINVPDGGTLRYSETVSLNAANGIINHAVGTGDHTAFGSPLDDTVFNRNLDVLLQVAVDTASNVVLPRTRLQSVPFAITARKADSATNGIPSGFRILGTSPIAPPNFTATGGIITGNWVARKPLPTATNGMGAAAVNGKIYAVGGDQGGSRSANLYQYDPGIDTWTTKAPMFTERQYPTCTELNGLLFVVGGFSPNGGVYSLSQNEVYYPATNTWGTSHPMTFERSSHGAAAVNGKLYVFGGYDDSFTYLASVEEFDPSANTWTNKNPMIAPRSRGAAAAVDYNIYVIGGVSDGVTTSANEEYNTLLDTWTPKAPMPVPSLGHAAVAFDGKVYVMGGGDTGSPNTWIYDPPSNTWTLGPPLATSRIYEAACLNNGKIYAIGGADNVDSWSTHTDELTAGLHYLFSKD